MFGVQRNIQITISRLTIFGSVPRASGVKNRVQYSFLTSVEITCRGARPIDTVRKVKAGVGVELASSRFGQSWISQDISLRKWEGVILLLSLPRNYCDLDLMLPNDSIRTEIRIQYKPKSRYDTNAFMTLGFGKLPAPAGIVSV